ncbi:MAG: MBL fold metallo-hydrolase [Ruminococcaceae bacterium]|nr:MBL fold metallo-hydrolase [Oscillospiraceae bacterium]
MSRFCPLFSSSSGNCTYIGYGDGAILIDAGVSCRSIMNALAAREIAPETIKAVAVTHSHSDHTAGLKALIKKLQIPVIASADTLRYLDEHSLLPPDCEKIIADQKISICGMEISSFCTSHDCCGSCGYTVMMPDDRRIAVCTDLGYISEDIEHSLMGCDLVMLESNHDINMLKKNINYPFPLKERILSDHGHLSNGQCSALLPRLIRGGTTRIVLAHLSMQNNLPMLALSSARACLTEAGLKEELDYILYVAPKEGGKMFIL